MVYLTWEGVDIDAATKHGIKVARIPSEGTGNAASCSEMAIYLMLGLLKKQVPYLYDSSLILPSKVLVLILIT